MVRGRAAEVGVMVREVTGSAGVGVRPSAGPVAVRAREVTGSAGVGVRPSSGPAGVNVRGNAGSDGARYRVAACVLIPRSGAAALEYSVGDIALTRGPTDKTPLSCKLDTARSGMVRSASNGTPGTSPDSDEAGNEAEDEAGGIGAAAYATLGGGVTARDEKVHAAHDTSA